MKILLTNDDGFRAPGITQLAEVLAARGHEVTICAPARQRSAVSHAVTLHKPLRLRHAPDFDMENIRVYYVSGTPADSVMLGLLDLEPETDMVISGINGGPNLGEDVIYSGTVGGAMEGALMGVRSMAVSLSSYEGEEYELAAHFAAGIAEQFAASSLPDHSLLNINVPPGKKEDYRGFMVVPLGTREYKDILEKRTDPRGQDYYWISGMVERDNSQKDTDMYAAANNLISITPITLDFTSHGQMKSLDFTDPITV